MIERYCWSCVHLIWITAEQGYSEYTPGSDVNIECGKGHWHFDMYADSREDFREKICSATACKDLKDEGEARGAALAGARVLHATAED